MNENTNLIDEHNEELTPIEELSPFKRMVLSLGTLPSAFYDTMTYYESLVYFYEYLKNEVIPTVNNNGEAVEELQTKYIELKDYVDNYFENLDVQEEINQKLDEMALDGTLTNLIKDYVDPIYEAYETSINATVDGLDDRIDAQDLDISSFKSTINEQIATINNKVTSATNGSPKGVYATVTALTTADPDHNSIYVVSADGNWYYYDTSSSTWVAGGTYIATPIEEGSITPEMTNFLSKRLNNLNVFDYTQLIDNYYIGTSTTPISASGWSYYETEDLIAGQTYTFGGDGHIIISCFNDADTNILLQDSANNRVFAIPALAKRIFISSSTSSAPNVWITKGSTAFNYKTDYFKFYVIDEEKINMDKYKAMYNIIVDINEKGDYTSLTDAVTHAQSGDRILVLPGTYTNETVEGFGKTLYITGIDKNTCIIKNSTCDYETPPIEMSVGLLENLTFIAEYDATNYGNTALHCYALHIEDNYMQNKKLLVKNCRFESQVNYGVGMGTRGGSTVEFNNCEMIGNNSQADGGQGGLYFHDASNVLYAGVQTIKFINNRILSTAGSNVTDLRIESQGTAGSTVNITFNNNTIVNMLNGNINPRYVDHASGTWKTSIEQLTNFHLMYDSYGNNLTGLNK